MKKNTDEKGDISPMSLLAQLPKLGFQDSLKEQELENSLLETELLDLAKFSIEEETERFKELFFDKIQPIKSD